MSNIIEGRCLKVGENIKMSGDPTYDGSPKMFIPSIPLSVIHAMNWLSMGTCVEGGQKRRFLA